jgi:hypothetical protein
MVPICPQREGEIFLKVLLKFEEESKFKEIEIKRYVVKFNVKPSIKFNLKEEILYNEATSIHFNLNINTFLENSLSTQNLTSLKIEKIYFNNNYELVKTKESEWKILENEKYHKLYSKLRFIKEKTFNSTNATRNSKINFFRKKSNPDADSNSMSNSVNTSINSTKNNKYQNFEFLSEENISTSNHQHIKTKLNQILSKDKIFFNWSAINTTNNQTINGLTIYETVLNIPSINKNFLKTVLKNSIKVEIDIQRGGMEIVDSNSNEQSLVFITFKLNKKGLLEIPDISTYEFYIQDEENDFSWVGLNRFKIKNKNTEEINFNDELDENNIVNMKFGFITNKKGTVEVNKIFVIMHPKNHTDKAFTLNNVPHSIMIDI